MRVKYLWQLNSSVQLWASSHPCLRKAIFTGLWIIHSYKEMYLKIWRKNSWSKKTKPSSLYSLNKSTLRSSSKKNCKVPTQKRLQWRLSRKKRWRRSSIKRRNLRKGIRIKQSTLHSPLIRTSRNRLFSLWKISSTHSSKKLLKSGTGCMQPQKLTSCSKKWKWGSRKL